MSATFCSFKPKRSIFYTDNLLAKRKSKYKDESFLRILCQNCNSLFIHSIIYDDNYPLFCNDYLVQENNLNKRTPQLKNGDGNSSPWYEQKPLKFYFVAMAKSPKKTLKFHFVAMATSPNCFSLEYKNFYVYYSL